MCFCCYTGDMKSSQTENILTPKGEQIHYLSNDLPYYVTRTYGNKPHTFGVIHWHQDIEISIVIKGTLTLNAAARKYTVPEGYGILINSKQLHGGNGSEGCDFICVRLHPLMLCLNNMIETEYVAPILNNPKAAVIFLDPSVSWQRVIMDDAREIYMFQAAETEGLPLLIEKYFFDIWYTLYTAIPLDKESLQHKRESAHMTCLRSMIGYIQKNYASDIRLNDIAAAGIVSISTCIEIFQQYVHETPVSYLISYRLNKAASLLYETDLSVTEIVRKCGFHDASYFSLKFKEKFGCTPLKYRKRSRE